MAFLINGIGVWNLGKSDLFTQVNFCPQCHEYGPLKSYSTREWFLVFYVPIVPIQRKRILQHCSCCQRYFETSLMKWQASKERDLTDALQTVVENPSDPDAVIAALEVSCTYQDETVFRKVAKYASTIEHAAVLYQLGRTYAFFDDREEAEQAYDRSLILVDDSRVRIAASWNAIQLNDPDKAIELIEFVIREKRSDQVGAFLPVIEYLQYDSRHDDVLDLIDRLESVFPDLLENRDFAKAVRLSRKRSGRGPAARTLTAAGTDRSLPVARKVRRGPFRTILVLLFLIALLLVGGYAGYSSWLSQNQSVYFVNGTTQSYSVTVNGQNIALTPEGMTVVHIAEGPITVTPASNDFRFDPIETEYHTNFWERPFSRPVLIVNPDRIGIIVTEISRHTKHSVNVNTSRIDVGQPYYQRDSVHYLFEPFPASSPNPNQKFDFQRTRLDRVRWKKNADFLTYYLKYVPTDESRRITLECLCRQEPDELAYLQALESYRTPTEMIEFLEAGLSRRPLAMNWHERYIRLVEGHQPNRDLVPYYRELLEQTKSADARCLLALATPDRAESDRLLKEAATASSHFAAYQIAQRWLCRGQFDEARAAADAALRLTPQPRYRSINLEWLWKNREFQEHAIRYAEFESSGLQQSLVWYKSLVLMGQDPTVIAHRNRVLSQALEYDMVGEYLTALDLFPLIVRSDHTAIVAYNQMPGRAESLHSALLRGKPQRAAELLDASTRFPEVGFELHALIALEANKVGQETLRQRHLARAIADLRLLGRDARLIAEMVELRRPIEIDVIVRAELRPAIKRTLFLLLAMTESEHARWFVQESKRFDYQLDLTSVCLSQIRDDLP